MRKIMLLIALLVALVAVVGLIVASCTTKREDREGKPQADQSQIVIKINTTNKADVDKLSILGIDIWEVHEDHVIASATDEKIKEIQKEGFSFNILFHSLGEYEQFLKSNQNHQIKNREEK